MRFGYGDGELELRFTASHIFVKWLDALGCGMVIQRFHKGEKWELVAMDVVLIDDCVY